MKHKQLGFSRWWYLIGIGFISYTLNYGYYAVFIDKDAWPTHSSWADSRCEGFLSEKACLAERNRLQEQQASSNAARRQAEEARRQAQVDAQRDRDISAQKSEMISACVSDPEYLTCFVRRPNCRQATESRLRRIERDNPEFDTYSVRTEYCESLYPRWIEKVGFPP